MPKWQRIAHVRREMLLEPAFRGLRAGWPAAGRELHYGRLLVSAQPVRPLDALSSCNRGSDLPSSFTAGMPDAGPGQRFAPRRGP